MSFVNVAIGASSAYTAIQGGKMAKGQADTQAMLSDYQGQVEQQNALETARIIRKAGRRQLGQVNAGYAGAGVQVGQGSAGDVEAEVTQNVEHDAFQALLDGKRRARGFQTDATMQRISGSMAQSASYVNAMGSVLQSGYAGMRANGWRTGGPGFSGQQAPAPVTTAVPRMVGGS